MLKIVGAFEANLKKYPPIKVGTPDPLHAAVGNCADERSRLVTR
jgi:hypothetical protein